MYFRLMTLLMLVTLSFSASAKTVLAAISEYERRLTETGELTVNEAKNLAKLYKLPMQSQAPANLLLQPASPPPETNPPAAPSSTNFLPAIVGGDSLKMHLIVSTTEFNSVYDINLALLAGLQVQQFNCFTRSCHRYIPQGPLTSGESESLPCPQAGPICFNSTPPAEYVNPDNFQLENGPDKTTKINNAINLIEDIYIAKADLAACESRCENPSIPRYPNEEESSTGRAPQIDESPGAPNNVTPR